MILNIIDEPFRICVQCNCKIQEPLIIMNTTNVTFE